MRYTKRSRKRNVQRILRWFMKERKLSELEVMLGMPELYDIVESGDELDFDDVVRAFDYLDVDVVCVPRGESKAYDWFCLTELPYDDGGKNRGWTLREERRHIKARKGRIGQSGIPKTDREDHEPGRVAEGRKGVS